VAAEMLAAQKGLGFMIQTNRMNSNPSYIIVAMLVIGVSGALFSALLGLLERLLRRS
jgi:ABC-type nitrate/sulfonate/bicarbonate transport system permease component